MTEAFPSAVRDRWRPGARFVFRTGRRTLVESLYLLIAPVIAAFRLLLLFGGLCARAAGLRIARMHPPKRWPDVAHAVVVFPVTLVTAVVTGLWWFVGIGAATSALRALGTSAETLRLTFGTAVGLLLLCALPLVTRACLAAQAGLGQALLSDTSALHRRISGLERERDTARAQTGGRQGGAR